MIREQEGEESGAVYFRVPLSGSAFRRRHSRQHVEGILDGNINSIYRAPAASKPRRLMHTKSVALSGGGAGEKGEAGAFLKE